MKIFCSGIGGIGLSAYAAYQAASGHQVLGSDRADSSLVEDLKKQGIAITLDQSGDSISEDIDLYVYSEAIPKDSPERLRAAALGIRSISYFQALGELTEGSMLIAVSGTHGKSSTTAIAARVAIECGLDPSVIIGTKMTELSGRNWRKGKSVLWIVEACEYRRSFHFLHPTIILLTNADGDHFDAYKDEQEYHDAFIQFVQKLPEDGSVIVHGNDAVCTAIAEKSGKHVLNADTFKKPALSVPGNHMQENAQLVLALAEHLQWSSAATLKALSGFAGTWRRMEKKGTMKNGALVIDDYAHHPLEIRATLAAMREGYPGRRIICVFQPHTHDRTKRLYDEFISSFTDADSVVIPDIYNARSDIEHGEVDIGTFLRDIEKGSDVQVEGGTGLADAEAWVEQNAAPNDLIIVMGAGSIAGLADRLVA